MFSLKQAPLAWTWRVNVNSKTLARVYREAPKCLLAYNRDILKYDSPPSLFHTSSWVKSHHTDQKWSEAEVASTSGEQTIDCLSPPPVPRASTMKDEQLVLTLLKEVISYHDKNMSSWVIENKVKTLVMSCKCLSKQHRESIIKALATTYSVDHDQIYQTLNKLKHLQEGSSISANEERQLKHVLTPLYIWLFKIVGRLEGGVKFLVDLRIDLIDMLQGSSPKTELYSSLQQLNTNLKDLLTLWFSVGFLKLERVTWRSSCEMLQKISEYEAVHPVRSWTDLKRRVGPYRRCFVYTHSSMPSEPIVVLHTALCPEIASSTRGIIAATQQMTGGTSVMADDSQMIEDPSKINTAIFYSVTSTQPGLQGIELGNYLIKRVVQELQAEFPQITQFSTLSPIPSFKKWLFNKFELLEKEEADAVLKELWTPVVSLFGGWKELKKSLHSNTWVKDFKLVSELENPLMTTCAFYLYKEKRKGMALDSVVPMFDGAELSAAAEMAERQVESSSPASPTPPEHEDSPEREDPEHEAGPSKKRRTSSPNRTPEWMTMITLMEVWAAWLGETRERPSVVVDWLMMTAVTTLQAPLVKSLIIKMRTDYTKYVARTSPNSRSFVEWLGVLPGGSYMTSLNAEDKQTWSSFLESCSAIYGSLSSASLSTTPSRTLDTATSSTTADGIRGNAAAAAQGCAAWGGPRDVASSYAQTETNETSPVFCNIFGRATDGSCVKKPMPPSGSTFVSIQIGSHHNLRDVPTKEWWRHMDLNARLLLDLTDDEHPLSWRVSGLIEALEIQVRL